MESTTLRPTPPLPTLVGVAVIVSLVALTVAGWALTAERMRGMNAGPGTDLGGLGWFLVAWMPMMAAMMFPSIAPAVLRYARNERGRDRRRVPTVGATAAFVAGYLVSWGAAGLLGYAVIEAVRSFDVGFLAWSDAGAYAAGGVILVAALYELTPLKVRCLEQCRSPRTFLLQSRRRGGSGL